MFSPFPGDSWRQSFGGPGLSVRNSNSMDMQNESPIANFYGNRSVFITGATGFMGKVSFDLFQAPHVLTLDGKFARSPLVILCTHLANCILLTTSVTWEEYVHDCPVHVGSSNRDQFVCVSIWLLFTLSPFSSTCFRLQVLVEKLLRSCPGIKNIYLLLRTKKGLDARQRLEELFNAKVRSFFHPFPFIRPISLLVLVSVEPSTSSRYLGHS